MDDIVIKKIKLNDLLSFSTSEAFKAYKNCPISLFRINSYHNNPRKLTNQFVLYLALINNELVAYRSILQDQITVNNKVHSMGWFSGNWVSPEHRRKGLSTLLFNEVKNDWENRLMYTNYAPASKALYDKSNDFAMLAERSGVRIYFKLKFYDLLAHRFSVVRRLKFIVKCVDYCFNLFFKPWFYLKKWQSKRAFQGIEQHSSLSPDIKAFIDLHPASVFNRTSVEYQWVLDYPWVKTTTETINYEFSYKALSSGYNFLVSSDAAGQINGIAWVKQLNGVMKMPYFVCIGDKYPLAKAVLAWAYKNNVSMFTSFNEQFLEAIKPILNIGVFKKGMTQKYFAMHDLMNELSIDESSIIMQDGDGDVIFT